MAGRGKEPSIRMLRSSLGPQTMSSKSTAPAFGLGTSTRDAGLKTYVSPEHAKKIPGNNSQGPVYRVYSSVGPQPDSLHTTAGATPFGMGPRLGGAGGSAAPGPGTYQVARGLGEQKESGRITSPRPVFGSATRDGMAKVYLDHELMKAYCGQESPPPHYNLPGGVGRQVVSTKANAPAARIGTGLRALDYQVARARYQPGPGDYRSPAGVGRQVVSGKASPPAFHFGKGTREALTNKTLISKEHDKGAAARDTPGPATANPYSGVGRQALSNRARAPCVGFGSARRLTAYETGTPGPGAYYA